VDNKNKREKTDYIIQSVVHALDIIESFKGCKEDQGVTELAKRLRLHKNNVFRLLATLETRGYIEQNKLNGNYHLGVKTFEMGQVFIAQTGLLKQARPVMDDLVHLCNETVYVGVLRGDRVVYLDIAETTQSVRVANRVGTLLPAYCTAVGKAQLAYLGEDELDKIFVKAKLQAYTKNTITEKDKLKAHLKEVAKKGYALDLEELEPDVFCIGVPVLDYTGSVVAGMCISGPGCRMGKKRMETELLPLVKSAGMEVSKRLGYNALAEEAAS
jgi:IclR family KDG regulon transcriptional repressor